MQALGVNKKAELGGIFAEHLMYCNDRLYTMLAMCLTGFFVHGFLPDSILAVVRVPIIKDRTGRIDKLDSYRPIALASIMSKVIESIVLDRERDLLDTCPERLLSRAHTP